MTSDLPKDRDSRRDAAGVMEAKMRCCGSEPTAAARKAAKQTEAEMERRLAAPPAEDWPEAAELALHLLKTFAASIDAREARLAARFAQSIVDQSHLTEARASPVTERPFR